ncbi:MAG: Uma2 family endonuclease [Caldilineaceae bacterium SB0664_bin_22]|nr:Uma2 family endonuclease [Caldilineaceae bacterium SB0664_bin_22]
MYRSRNPVSATDTTDNSEAPRSESALKHGRETTLTTGPTSPWFPKVPEGKDGASTWWAYIKDLPHYDPNYPYDPRHTYGPDGTDDDAYGKDGVHFPVGRAQQTSIHGCVNEAWRLLGRDRVFTQRCLKLPNLGVPRTNRYARCGQVMPDVFIQERPRPGDNGHYVAYDPDNPIVFVLQVLFQSTFHYDLGPKVDIYRAMGVREYWRYDPDRLHRRTDEPLLWGLRLSAAGEYEDIEPLRTVDGQPVYHSEMLGEFRMLDEGESYYTFQTWDATRSIWLDPEQALKLEVATRIRMEYLQFQLRQQADRGVLETHVPDTLAAAWHKANWVPDVANAVDVLLGTEDWSTLLPPGDHRT